MKISELCIVPGVIVFGVSAIIALSIFNYVETAATVEVGQVWVERIQNPFRTEGFAPMTIVEVRGDWVQFSWAGPMGGELTSEMRVDEFLRDAKKLEGE